MPGFGLPTADFRQLRELAGQAELLFGDLAHDLERDHVSLRVSGGFHRRFDQVVCDTQDTATEFVQ